MDAFRIAVCPLVVTMALAGPVLSPGPAGAAPPAQPPGADRDVHHLVLLAPGHPVFIEMRVQVDGQGLKSVRTAYAAKLFERYDKDGDRLLDKEEAKAIPPLVKSASASETVSIADRWEAVDVNPADDKVSLEELAAYIDRVFGSTFLLSVKPKSAAQSVDLFPLLDLNHDGRISRAELEAAPQILHKLDLDDDETYTIDELQPFRNPQIPQGPATPPSQTTEQPFLLLDDPDSIERVAQQLQQRYGATASGSGRARMSREVLGLDEASFAPHDADGDGSLDAGELAAFLKSPVPHLVIEAQFRKSSKEVRPSMIVVEDRLGAGAKDKSGSSVKIVLAVSGVDVDLKMGTVSQRNDAIVNRTFYTTEFRRVGGNKKGYLSEPEFAGLRLPNAEFKSVDRNGDGMIVIEELLAYVEQESASSQSRVELSISHDGQSVFEVIDVDRDRRISRRELMHAFDRLRTSDRDGDEAITAVELAGRFSGTLELGRPNLLRSAMTPRGDMTTPNVSRPTAGPDWFRKMDRNRDGDLSLREFLGPLAVFRKLDADGDGLISAAEAEKAGEFGTPAAR